MVPRRIMSVLQKKRVTRVCVAHGHSAVVTDEGHLFTFGKTLLPLSLPHNPPPQGSSAPLIRGEAVDKPNPIITGENDDSGPDIYVDDEAWATPILEKN